MKAIGLRTIFVLAALWAIIYYPDMASAGDSYEAKVLATSLNVRAEAAQTAEVIGSFKYGAQIQVYDEKFGWAEVRYGSKKGWVAAHYLKKGDAANAKAEVKASGSKAPSQTVSKGQSTSEVGIVTADSLRMRDQPGLEGTEISFLSKSATVRLLEQEQGWMKVRAADGTTGWVSGKYVAFGQAAASVTATSASTSRTLKGKRIVIDPGHGGKDSGAISAKQELYEKDLNLSTALLVAEALRSAGATVYLTRDTDVYIEMENRTGLSNSKNADAFISIHYNAALKTASGINTFYYSKDRDKSLASAVQKQLIQATGLRDRGVEYGDYYVLRENTKPSILLELGYLSNPSEEAVVVAKSYRQTVAQAVLKGLQQYFS